MAVAVVQGRLVATKTEINVSVVVSCIVRREDSGFHSSECLPAAPGWHSLFINANRRVSLETCLFFLLSRFYLFLPELVYIIFYHPSL